MKDRNNVVDFGVIRSQKVSDIESMTSLLKDELVDFSVRAIERVAGSAGKILFYSDDHLRPKPALCTVDKLMNAAAYRTYSFVFVGDVLRLSFVCGFYDLYFSDPLTRDDKSLIEGALATEGELNSVRSALRT